MTFKNDMIDEAIETLEEAGGEEAKIAELEALRDELSDDATDEETMEGIQRVLGVSHETEEEDTEELSEEDAELLEENCATVKEYLDGNGWHYGEENLRDDLKAYYMGMGVNNARLQLKIYVEADPSVCRISAILPVTADPIYAYPLTKRIAAENYQLRFGCLKYDERDGELLYEYSFKTKHGIQPDDLDEYVDAVLHTAANTYETVRKYAVGKFKGAEIDKIVEEAKTLVRDLTEE